MMYSSIHHSNVDQASGQNYLARLLAMPVQPLFDLSMTGDPCRVTPARLAARKRAQDAAKQRTIEFGERIFERLKWKCTTREFSYVGKCDGLKTLRRLADFGKIECTEESIGTKPAKWKWRGK